MSEAEPAGPPGDAGSVRYSFRDYVFTSRPETTEEYLLRSAAPGGPDLDGTRQEAAGGADAGRVFRVTAGFAEHNERLGSSASVFVTRAVAPGAEEAEDLVWPAVRAETVRLLGEGEWWPSLNWVDVVELRASDDAGPGSLGEATRP